MRLVKMIRLVIGVNRLINYVEIIDHRKSIIQVSQNNLKINYFLSIYRFYRKFSYNSLYYSASSCHSHFGATSYQLFCSWGPRFDPMWRNMYFFFKFSIIFLQIGIFFCKNRQIFLQKLSNFLTKIVKIFLCKSSNFPRNHQVFQKKQSNFTEKIVKFSDHVAQIVKFSSKNWQIYLRKDKFSRKIVKCQCKDRSIFLQKSSDFLVEIVNFTVKFRIYGSFYMKQR